jgi:uncharacterized protein
VHPPKTALFDLAAGVNVDTKGCARAVDEYRETPFGLYMSRAMIDRPTAHWVESWLLPDLGLCVTDWWWNPGHLRDQDFYLDICEIERDGDRWRLTDHYLDIVVRNRRGAEVVDVDEFVAAVATGLLSPTTTKDEDDDTTTESSTTTTKDEDDDPKDTDTSTAESAGAVRP